MIKMLLLDKFIVEFKTKELGNRKLFGHKVLSLVSGNGVGSYYLHPA